MPRSSGEWIVPRAPAGDEPSLIGLHVARSFEEATGRTPVLRDVSLELYPGQVTLLMGPSGSGKSTLLAILSGLLRPDEGEVRVLGSDLWGMSEVQREQFRLRYFGFIFQGYNLFPALTALQQLEMILRWGQGLSASAARQRAQDQLALLGLGPKKWRLRPSELSGGEKQRVAIGRALCKEPHFCFADEPTSALDWTHGKEVIELIRNAAHDRGATILIVAHDERIKRYVDRVLHLDEGCLREDAQAQRGLALQDHH